MPVCALLVVACNAGAPHGLPEVPVDLPVARVDRMLFHAPPDSLASVNLRLQAELGEDYRVYIEDILRLAPLGDPRLSLALTHFTSDPDWREAQRAVDSVLGDLGPQRILLTEAFGRLKGAFPDSLTPRIVVFNSGYNYGIYPTDSMLGIGVEWFIGPEEPVVRYLATETFPQYVKDRMMPGMLAPAALKGWLMVHYLDDLAGADLLTDLVATGKVMALLDALLPDTDPALKFAFTGQQLRWCEEHEYLMWKDIVSADALFSKSQKDIGRIMNDGPFTPGFPRESPGHVGEWIGYRMVKNYLDDHPATTFAQLFALDDPRQVLKSYKPR